MTAPNHKPTPSADAKPGATDPADKPMPAKKESMRETIESIAVAFLLAFLFRAFEAEAFVIPTGSMAPTLYGRHKEATCKQCGHLITIGASKELDNETGMLVSRVEMALCPNCRAPNEIKEAPAFNGDRILVNKFPFELHDPRRWDVVVFKFPEEPKTNYIKRLVGLPNETLIIRQGDLFRSEPGEGAVKILRKSDPNKQRDVQILVHDNDFPEQALIDAGWPRRWASVVRTAKDQPHAGGVEVAGWHESPAGWQAQDATHGFRLTDVASTSQQHHWLRYRHFVPTPDVWRALLKDAGEDRLDRFGNRGEDLLKSPRPQLITDFCGYNAQPNSQDYEHGSLFWVGDLTLGCTVKIDKLADSAELLLELNQGVHRFRCRIDPQSGEAQLLRVIWLNRNEAEEELLAKATTSLRGTGRHRVEFANVDQRLCLWIDGGLVNFGNQAEYTLSEIENLGPQEEDLTPIGIAARGLDAEVSQLQIHRDIYYQSTHEHQMQDYSPYTSRVDEWSPCSGHQHLRHLVRKPAEWWESYLACRQEVRFDLGPEEYLMLGDNSPESSDGRLWSNRRAAQHRHAVPRSALIGKAFYIYWPHGQPFLNGGKGYPAWYHKNIEQTPLANGTFVTEEKKTDYPSVRLPFYPNFGRMQRIR